MSKRPFFPQQSGDRKKAKLDVTISDHNFPLSQNGPNKESEQNNWGDDNDDEILLLASQACEDAYNDINSLPDYSMCMQPASTSTQLSFDPGPSTSKSTFSFKKPSGIPPSAISSNLKDKCNRISSPLPGMSSKVLPKRTDHVDITDDFVFNDKIFKGQDSDLVYKQLLQLQEENAKLKSENGKLLEKCVTKEGEASILRTQLKSSQTSVDNARMEKIKAQEKVQIEWTQKLNATNSQIQELRTQLDFKNLEIISIKERCKMLESNKVKLTQVTVPTNDISSSQRMNNILSTSNVSIRKPKMASSSVQTEDKAHFLKLNKTCRSEPSNVTPILPLILESTTDQHSILEYNEKLQKHTDSAQNKCRVYSTFHRVPSSSTAGCQPGEGAVHVGVLYEDLTRIAAGTDEGKALDSILSLYKSVLHEMQSQLELISRKMSPAFQKEMDERYIDASDTYLVVSQRDLLRGRPLYKEEQAILGRRVAAVVAHLASTNVQLFRNNDNEFTQILDILQRICNLLDSTSCALLYSGFLLSTTNLIINTQKYISKTIDILKHMIYSRAMPFVSCQLLKLLRKLSLDKSLITKLCPRSSAGNLRMDYDQGVLLYKKDSCYLQVLLKQVESSLKCIEQQRLIEQAIDTTIQLIAVHSNLYHCYTTHDREKSTGCDCQLVLLQVIVYALRILAVMWKTSRNNDDLQSASSRLLSVCTLGTQLLYTRSLSDVEFSSHLAQYEGHLQHYADIMRSHPHNEIYANMLSELSGSFQSSPEEGAAASAGLKQPWLDSFNHISIAD